MSIETVELSEVLVMTISATAVAQSKIGAKLGEMLSAVFGHVVGMLRHVGVERGGSLDTALAAQYRREGRNRIVRWGGKDLEVLDFLVLFRAHDGRLALNERAGPGWAPIPLPRSAGSARLLLQRADVRDDVGHVVVREVAPRRHGGVAPEGGGALLDDHGQVGVLARGAVLVRVEPEVAHREVAGRRGEGGAGRPISHTGQPVAGPTELLEGDLSGGGVGGESRCREGEGCEQRSERRQGASHGWDSWTMVWK